METTAVPRLGEADVSARYDAVCKRLLSEKQILARIMKECLEEYRGCDANEIAEKYIEGQPQVGSEPVMPDQEGTVIQGLDTEDKSVREGVVTYDIRFRALVPGSGERIGLMINVEAQNDFYPGYPLIKRGIYYGCRMISSQYGREFTASHYEKIKKVYSIWICMKPPKYRENTITRYRLVEEQVVGKAVEPLRNYDLLTVMMLCLGQPDGENYQGILRMLGMLFSKETSKAEKRRILRDDYGIQMTQSMEGEVSTMCNLSKGLLEEGETKGIAKGIAKGIVQGTTETNLSVIKNLMHNLEISAERAMSLMGLPDAEHVKYLELLARQ